MARTKKKKSNRDELRAKINPLLREILRNTPKGEDPKKGGVPYRTPGTTHMDGTPRAKRKKRKSKKA